MKRIISVITVFLCCICSTFSLAEETPNAEETSKGKTTENKSARSSMLFGQPVNVSIAGGGALPKGKMLTILNASFADKTNVMNGGGKNPDAFSQSWLFKFRYGHHRSSGTVHGQSLCCSESHSQTAACL